MEKTIEEIEKEIEAQQELYMKAKAEAEAKEMSLIAQDTDKTLKAKLNSQIAKRVDSDDDTKAKIDASADRLIEKGLKVQEKQINKQLKTAELEENKAEFELSEDQYKAFGQSIAPKKKWQKKLIEFGYDFWFCVMHFICFWTLAPFYIFLNVIKNQKGVLKFVAVFVGIILLLICLTSLTFACLKWTGAIKF
ncbi:MAG: hypothetical protein IJS74_02285 [Clostridia bacterium]|nr:hypothetical protein [Clostridia bacterium]